MSQEQLTHISKVQIHKLWGKYDIEWNLHKDVNILSGVNGSGKSTVLRIIYNLIKAFGVDIEMPSSRVEFFNSSSINFDKGVFSTSFQVGSATTQVNPRDVFQFQNNTISHSILNFSYKFDLIQTFDSDIANSDIYNRLSKNEKSPLNVTLEILQRQYLSFRIDLSKRKDNFLEQNMFDEARNVNQTWHYFLDTIDKLFVETGKKVDRSSNDLSFVDLNSDMQLSVNILSSGEKQLLIIMMTVLIQDCKPSILLLDEPEISLHLDWQDKLIGIVRTLNPNAQLIIATHSPWIIVDGWKDYVTEISEIIK